MLDFQIDENQAQVKALQGQVQDLQTQVAAGNFQVRWQERVVEPVIKVKKLSASATLPVRGSAQAAGYDLSSAVDVVIPARGKGIVPTNLSIVCPEGTYGRIAPRSGLAWKKHIDVGAGVIDQDYRGDVGIVLFNHAEEDLEVTIGMRVAQLI